jgi:seryl-tRNA synthetase
MHDIKFVRENPAAFDAALARRGKPALSPEVLELDEKRRALQTNAQAWQARRNEVSKEVGNVKKSGGDASALMAEVATLKDKIATVEAEEAEIAKRLHWLMSTTVNLPAADVPNGKNSDENVERHRVGEPKRLNSAKEHFDLGEGLGLMDFETAAKLSGARFTLLKGALCNLERALGQFMLDLHTREHGYTEMSPPLMVNENIIFGTSNLDKFEDDLFKVSTGHFLIPTAEVPLTNIVNDTIVPLEELPLRLTAMTPCFRAEAGAAGRDTRGMIRQHQFYKVELVSITAPEKSVEEHERMLSCAEAVLKKLELPFRTMTLCTGDMGFASQKTYDIEVWLPGQNQYREISSCSNCGDFQARRMNARTRASGDKNTRLVHTLNGSGVAVGRALIAVMENYQQPDGSIAVPTALQPYLGGVKLIEAKRLKAA